MGRSRRGSLTSTADRSILIKLVKEAIENGAHQKQTCQEVGISARTLQRWCKQGANETDQRPVSKHPTPVNKLTDEECASILEIANQAEFKSMPPSQIVPTLADQGIYMASESTMYRVLREAGERTIAVAAQSSS